MSNFLLKTFVSTQGVILDSIENFKGEGLKRIHEEETGAEAVQVIMIMGIMAVIVGIVFVAFRKPLIDLANKVANCIGDTQSGSASTGGTNRISGGSSTYQKCAF